jgi:hypothetical protein
LKRSRSGQAGLAILLLAAGMTVGDWLPAPRAEAVPGTIAREVRIDAGTLRAGTPLRAAGDQGLRALDAGLTPSAPVVVCAPIRFTAVGLTWDQPSGHTPHVLLQAGDDATTFRRVMELHDAEGPDPGTADARGARRATDPIWVHDARCIRIRLAIPAGVTLSNLRAMFVNTSGTAGVETPWHEISGTTEPSATDVAGATANAPYWTTRAGWGADESLRNCGPSYAPALKMAFVHHTATENTYAKSESDDIVRSVYYFHTEGRGWCDIAYNFLVDKYGKVFVGRFGGPAQPVIGAAQMGFNTGAASVATIGTYGATTPPAAMITSLKKILAWRLDVAHVPPKGWAWMVSGGGPNTKYPEGKGVTLHVISGHRDTGYTDCPGDLLYGQLGALREGANAVGLPKMWRTKQSTDTITPGTDTVQYTATGSESLLWTLTMASDATGAPIQTWSAAGVTLNVVWDGMQGLFPAPEGAYTATLMAKNPSGGIARAATFHLTVNPGGGVLPFPVAG